VFHELGLDALVVIGGDGTLAIAHEFYKRGLPIVGVPKTIDNDIVETTNTFGFDTAVAFATHAIDRLHTTAQSHHRVMVVEVMGRYAGWIALYSGVAGGADAILIPEIPFDREGGRADPGAGVVRRALQHRRRGRRREAGRRRRHGEDRRPTASTSSGWAASAPR
jgi:6-phosphofructokinase